VKRQNYPLSLLSPLLTLQFLKTLFTSGCGQEPRAARGVQGWEARGGAAAPAACSPRARWGRRLLQSAGHARACRGGGGYGCCHARAEAQARGGARTEAEPLGSGGAWKRALRRGRRAPG